ncbi:oxysterol-binding protein-related protein 9-like [Dysidea avara]|uniref:oxysterol-binding protein-related protein 9-like n=1 Tax=Dysidea avara TaxID=196820 RepID=UPI00331D88FA
MMSRSTRVIEGPLSKWTNMVNGWQYRWFVLDQTSGLLSYYTSKEKMSRGSRRGCMKLRHAIVSIEGEDDCTFSVCGDNGHVFHLQARDNEERARWVISLEETTHRNQTSVSPGNISPTNSLTPQAVDVAALTHKLQEAEAYQQLLSTQSQALLSGLPQTEESQQLQLKCQELDQAIQQCIDQLKGPLSMVRSGQNTILPGGDETSDDGQAALLEQSSGHMSDSESNASSDTFYDATSSSINGSMDDVHRPPSPGPLVNHPSISIPSDTVCSEDVEEDADDIHEFDDAKEGVAQNRNVIMHLLSQVRIGMDLSRVTLPTFILEKRSLLEMYADFFSHPDLLVKMSEAKTPRDRMICATHYYLSTFHTVRKGTIAKKPYNPILGETFQCYWDLPKDLRASSLPSNHQDVTDGGPVPWANYNSVSFVAEQVSHHPPISGFYAECPCKKMYCNGYIYTKSRFLGLSLGVHNIGEIKLHLLEHDDEVYSVTLPSAYGRSILTVPWVELGGKCTINCEKTGYYANIEFHCKPFYGGKKHRVTGDVYQKPDKKPFLRIEGEWNKIINIKPASDKEEPTVIDTCSMPPIKKKVRKVYAQIPTESRHLWQHLTKALHQNDIEAATSCKHQIEEKQRADARERKEKGIEWQQKLFVPHGDGWLYKNHLGHRLTKQQAD